MKENPQQSNMAFFLFALFALKIHAQFAATTTQDGVFTNYNQYPYFNGNQGYFYQNSIPGLTSYTLSIWTKLQYMPYSLGRQMSVIGFSPNAFTISYTVFNQLNLASDGGGSFTIDASIRNNSWYMIVVRSSQSYSSVELRDVTYSLFSSNNLGSFFPFGYTQFSYQSLVIGIARDRQSDGFYGNIRNIRIFNQYYDDQTVQRIQFTYIFPNQYLMLQILLRNPTYMWNDADRSVGQQIGSQSIQWDIDYMGSLWCFTQPTTDWFQFVDFSKSLSLTTYNVPSSQLNTGSDFSTTLQIWFYRNGTANVNLLSDPNEVLFQHLDVTKVSFLMSDYSNLRVDCLNTNTNPYITLAGFNRWFYLQVTSTPTYFKVGLYNTDGSLNAGTTVNYQTTTQVSSSIIYIAQNFNGNIFGVKYYKTASPPQSSVYQMVYSFDTSPYALLYFMFSEQGMSQSGQFQNLALNSNTQSLSISGGQLQFSNGYFRQLNSNEVSGTINQPLSFDGYSCINNRERLYMPSTNSYSTVSFGLNSSLSAFTMELWIKPTQTIVGGAFFVTLQEQSGNQFNNLAILQESGVLKCYPFKDQQSSVRVDYLDYSQSSRIWNHVSCIYDISQMIVEGTLYVNQLDRIYFADLTSQTAQLLQQQSLTLYLNVDPHLMQNGASGIFYSEVRFWAVARTLEQIRSYRFEQLDVVQSRPYLYSYLKLADGKKGGNPFELDFADWSLGRQVDMGNSAQWQEALDLTVCPLYMYWNQYNNNDNNCYREGIIDLYVTIYKIPDTSYVVTAMISQFRNTFLRDDAVNVYNYQWTLTGLYTGNQSNSNLFPQVFNSQNTQQTLTFGFGQVTNMPAVYSMTLNMQDKQNFQTPQQVSVVLKTYSCANIFDANTGLSFVQMDMESTQTVQDIVFYYQFTDCTDYVFDQNSMTFDVDIPGVLLSSSNHNSAAQSYTLPRMTQSGLPSNEYFHLRMNGVWRNTGNGNDVIQYSLVYACRFIAKLVVTLQPSMQIVSYGQTLTVDYQAVFANLGNQNNNYNYSAAWTCSGVLNNLCAIQTGPTLRLYYQQIQQAGVQLFQPYTITLNAYTNFIQGDGSRFSSSSVTVTWINLLPEANITVLTNQVATNSLVAFEFSSITLTDAQISLQWQISPQINAQKCVINSNNRKQFVISTACLNTNQQYVITSQLYYKNYSQVVLQQQKTFTLTPPPQNGRLSCSPSSGTAFIDQINCTTSSWSSQYLPLTYQFFFIDNQGNTISFSPISSVTQAQAILPPTQRIQVWVTDSLGNIAIQTTSVSINYVYQASISTSINSLIASFNPKTSDLLSSINALQWASYAMVYAKSSQIQPATLLQFRQQIGAALASLGQIIPYQSTNFNRWQGIRGIVQGTYQLSNTNLIFDKDSLNNLQMGLYSISGMISDLQVVLMDDKVRSMLVQTQVNILEQLLNQQTLGNITQNSHDDTLSNITAQMRVILSAFEQAVGITLFEGQVYSIQNPAFNLTINKYSRLANLLYDFVDQSNPNLTFIYPLSSALQPTERQSFTVISFNIVPFIGSSFYNQTELSDNSVYFSYRDMYGNYLGGEDVLGTIQMLFAFDYAQSNVVSNTTTCGYINAYSSQWDNSSCQTQFLTNQDQIQCSCKHMSYYAIIDDYLKTDQLALDQLQFNNWLSLIPALYMLILYVIGTIYCYSKDNQDFQELSKQDDSQGLNITSPGSITISSLAFKRKVFYMGFSEKYSFCTLYRLYIMLLHPLLQIRNRFDPEIPRYYRFILMYTRLMIIMGFSFYFLKDYSDFQSMFEDMEDLDYKIIVLSCIVGGGALLLMPVPMFLFCCCRSKYALIKPINDLSLLDKLGSDVEQDDPNGVPGINHPPEKISNICIDPNLPMRLLFLLNSVSCKNIIQDYQSVFLFSKGNPRLIGRKILELDQEINNNRKTAEHTAISNAITERKLQDDQVHTESAVKNGQTFRSARQLEEDMISNARSDQNSPFNSRRGGFQSKSSILKKSPEGENRPQKPKGDSPNRTEHRMINHSEIDFEIKEEDEEYKSQIMIHEGGEKSPSPKMGPNPESVRNQAHTSHRDVNSNTKYEGDKQEEGNNFDRTNSDMMMESYIGSLESQLFADDKKELIEERNVCWRLFWNIIFTLINLAVIAAILYFYSMDKYYLVTNNYVWIVAFFAAQFIGFLVFDFIILLLLSCSVGKCCKRRKICLSRFYKESFCINEDYQYIVNFSDNKLQQS